jgi:pyrroline-5-carboxylate reductase
MKILIIGAGKMGEAVLKRWLQNNFEFKKAISVVEINKIKRNILKKKYADV